MVWGQWYNNASHSYFGYENPKNNNDDANQGIILYFDLFENEQDK